MAPNQEKNEGPYSETATKAGSVPQAKIAPTNERGKQNDHTVAILSFLAVGVVISSALLRNSLVQSGQSLMSASGDYMTTKWDDFYNYCDGDLSKMTVVFYIVAMLNYWGLGCLFLIPDVTGKPSFITRYKVQREVLKIDPAKLKKAILSVLQIHIIHNPIGLLVFYHVIKLRGFGVTASELPTFRAWFTEMLVFVAIQEVAFFYSHWFLHYPPLYKRIHKKHHEWTAPIGLITVYCHPIENALSNSIPAAIGPFVMRSHVLTTAIWLILIQTVSMVHHSGYHLPFLPSPEFHDFHHLKFNNCFGFLGILDWLHGTDVNYRKSKQFLRDKAIFSITPINDAIPDDPKKM